MDAPTVPLQPSTSSANRARGGVNDDEKRARAFRTLDAVFGSPANQKKGFTNTDTAAHSAATLLAARLSRTSFSTVLRYVHEWYAVRSDANRARGPVRVRPHPRRTPSGRSTPRCSSPAHRAAAEAPRHAHDRVAARAHAEAGLPGGAEQRGRLPRIEVRPRHRRCKGDVMNVRCLYHRDLAPDCPGNTCTRDATFAGLTFGRIDAYPIVCADHVDDPLGLVEIGVLDRTRATNNPHAVQS